MIVSNWVSRWDFGVWGSWNSPFPQSRLDKSPDQVDGDLLGERLTKRRRCEVELQDRALAASLSQPPSAISKPKKEGIPSTGLDHDKDQFGSSDSSAPPMPKLIAGLSDDVAEREPPIPTPPVCEYVTWGGILPMWCQLQRQ